MTGNEVGLIAVLDLAGFNRSYARYISALGSMNFSTDATAKSLSKSFLGLGDSLLKIAGILSVAVVAGATVAGAALVKMSADAIKKAADLEQGIANIASVLNMTSDKAGFMKDVIIDLGLDPTLKVTTFEAAEAMELLAKNGIFAGLSIQDMEQAARDAGKAVILLANATGAGFGQAANIATDAMVLFNEDASNMVDIVSNITGVTTNSKFTIDDYELALRNGGAAVAAFGVSLEDFNTMVALSAEELGTGMKAGTGWLNFMNRLTPNTEKATNVMKDLGIITADGTNRFFTATGELKDMSEVAVILNDVLFGTHKVVSEVSNRTTEQNALLAELNTEYLDAKNTIADYTTGVKSLLASEGEKNAAIAEAQAIIDKITPTMDELNSISSDYTTELQKLSTEQRMVALETIFGNDALKSAIALAKEGAPVTSDFTAVMDAFGVSAGEAFAMIADGLTEYELLQQQISNTSAIENAETRMDTLRGKLDILGGVIEGLKIKYGDPFVTLLNDIVDKVLAWFENNVKLEKSLINIGESIAGFIGELVNGEPLLDSVVTLIENLIGEDAASKFLEVTTAIQNFIAPIREFVDEHSEEFMGALKGIGVVLVTAMGVSLIAGIAGALWALVNPVTAIIVAVGLLGAAWEGNWGNIQGIAETAIGEITRLLDSLGVNDILSNLADAFDTGGIVGVFQALPGELSKLLSKLTESISNWFSNIDWVAVINTVRENLTTLMSGLGSSLGTGVNFLVEWLSNVDWVEVGATIQSGIFGAIAAVLTVDAILLEAVFNFFKSLFETIDWLSLGTTLKDMFFGLITGMADGITGFVETLASIKIPTLGGDVDTVGEAFDLLMEKMAPVISLFNAVRDTVVPAVETIIAAFQNFRFAITDWSGGSDDALKTVDIWDQLKATWEALQPIVEFLISAIAVLWGALEALQEALRPIVKFLISAIAVLWGAWVSFSTGALAGAIEPLLTGLGMAFTGLLQVIEGLANTLTGLFDIIVGLFTGNTQKIQAGWDRFLAGTIKTWEGLFNVISGIVGGGFETIVGAISGGLQSIYDFFVNLYMELVGASIVPDMVNAIIQWFFTLDDQIVATVISLVNSAITWFTNMRDTILVRIGIFVLTMVAKFYELFEKIKTAIEEKVAGILEKFLGFINDIIALFTNTDWKQLGKNIMDGIIDGILNKLAAAKAALQGVASDLQDAWNDFWNSHSPSRLMIESGEDIMAGATIGVMRGSTNLVNAMGLAGSAASLGFDTGVSNVIPRNPGVSPTTNNNSTVQNFNVNNSFAGSPQITDADQLKLSLAGFN